MLSYLSFYLLLVVNLPYFFGNKGVNPEELLAGEVSKDWRISSSSADASETVPSCKSTSQRVQDNTYTFFADGKMEWDNGEITEGPEENGCGDYRDLVGEWVFINNQSQLVWTFIHDKHDPSITINNSDTLIIERLENDLLVLVSTDQQGNPLRMSMVPR